MPIKSTDKTFSLRLPIDWYNRLEVNAKKEKRSVNAEILIAIEKHLTEVDKRNKGESK